MSRVVALLLFGTMVLAAGGCVGPMGAGCCGPVGFPGGCDSACHDGACGECDSCTGCGELYVDPWINHPADCVDPCDVCGNFNGQSCGKCRSVFDGFRSLWGYRCGCPSGPMATTDRQFAPLRAAPCGGCDAGCDECLVEPSCGCEGPCQCGTVWEPGCGVEPGCGWESPPVYEPGCGLEPVCGCEGSCSCGPVVGGNVHGGPVVDGPVGPGRVMESQVMPEDDVSRRYPAGSDGYVIESPGSTSGPTPYRPSRTRKIFRPRNASRGGGFLNDHRR